MAGKADVVEVLAEKVGLSKKQAAEAFDATFDAICNQLKKGERVQLPGFGSFSVKKRAARKGRNPKTNEPIMIKASKGVGFRAGKELKDALNKAKK